ncbi:SpaA isopeptide-forming pilin-related protein [Bifidobacterium oedipodis]|uniref:SpaA-like prealbumin fold domain-containing protein n=1 Tax=Bifidobacterium oedipodis TaxID=2675322 RepID=A0A7Y0HTI9_9BIFI|nr:SpaA isopeptide-forming pilin-related protein [Bifidobacterium sp. DSM 109957]NMM95146.1 hypothetical protein [Bifidobacterium sp. DSM 109957]
MALSAALIFPATATAQPSDDEIAADQDTQQTLPAEDDKIQNDSQNNVSDDALTSTASTDAPDYSNIVCDKTINAVDDGYAQALQQAIANSSNDASQPTVICLAGTFELNNDFNINNKHVVLRNADNTAVVITRTQRKANPLFTISGGGSLTVDTADDSNEIFRYGPKQMPNSATNAKPMSRFAQVNDANSSFAFNHGMVSGINVVEDNANNSGKGALVLNKYGTVTINGGTFTNNVGGDHGDGGTVVDVTSGVVVINDGIFSGNKGRNGGVIYLRDSSTLTVNGGTFSGNTASRHGGAIFAKENSAVTIGQDGKDNNAVIFENNTVTGTGTKVGGGALYVTDAGSQLAIKSGTFTSNRVDEVMDWNNRYSGGGAVWAQGTISISGGLFSNNVAGPVDNNKQTYVGSWAGGGALFVYGTESGKHTIVSTLTIADPENTVENPNDQKTEFNNNLTYGDGGAIFLGWGSEAILVGGKFTNNTSYRLGGAIYTEDETTTYMARAFAEKNYAGHFGGGLWLCPSGQGVNSKGGNMIAVNNRASKEYDKSSAGENDNTDAAGDDFALMSPTKTNISNSFELSDKGWGSDNTKSVVQWWQDGTLTSYTDGLAVNSLADTDGKGKNKGLAVAEDSIRYANQQQHTEQSAPATFTSTNKGGVPQGAGVALKATWNSENGEIDQYRDHANVLFQNNTAWYSGGAFGTNGSVIFDTPYRVAWNKVDADTKLPLAGSTWKLTIKGSDIKQTSEIGRVTPWFSDKFRNQECRTGKGANAVNCWHRTEGAVTAEIADDVWEATVSDQGDFDQDPDEGQINLNNLALGTFTLQEVEAPVGYELSETTYTFTTVKQGLPEIKVQNGGAAVNKNKDGIPMIGNSSSTAPISWTKVDSTDDEHNPLAGSKWKLERKALPKENSESTAENTAEVSYETVYSSICDAGAENCTEATVDTNGSRGIFTLNLPWGYEYKLTEIQAPDGFETPDSATTYVTFSVDLVTDPKTGESAASASAMTFHGSWPNWADKATCSAPTSAAASRAAGDTSCLIANKPGIELPATGGAGTTAMIWAGILLVGCSLAGLSYMRRRL